MVLSGRNEDKLRQIVEECNSTFGNKNVYYKVADATCEADQKELVQFTIEKFGKIDILILSAGVAAHSRFADIENIDVVR